MQHQQPAFAPPPGSVLRKAVLDALREEVFRVHGLEVRFVVEYMSVKDNWAWVHTFPESPDGRQHYEDISALLKYEKDGWTVIETPCTENENPDCCNGSDYFYGMQSRYPEVPFEIFPVQIEDAYR
ncbi:MAG: hypothetical protein OQK67_00670 [Chlorobium sp.]|nr:hypothetical protein [Chlorobium sp.]MCW8815164.1 hypothetical protein [Chlorobium sp.]MCW8820183.1 hypothetical protein [Ignavibacteriaceae bacterium]